MISHQYNSRSNGVEAILIAHGVAFVRQLSRHEDTSPACWQHNSEQFLNFKRRMWKGCRMRGFKTSARLRKHRFENRAFFIIPSISAVISFGAFGTGKSTVPIIKSAVLILSNKLYHEWNRASSHSVPSHHVNR